MPRLRIRWELVTAALVVLGAWLAANLGRIAREDDDAIIRFVLGLIFAVLALLRPKPEARRWTIPLPVAVGACVTGTVLAIIGLVFEVHLVEWVGILGIVLGLLLIATPPRFGLDVCLAVALLFWMHPLPGQLFLPLQSRMQWLSVQGAEWILQAINTRVWADGIQLKTGFHIFMVPESCSGMRTAVTVFLCTLGVGALLRLRWFEMIFFVVAGLAQVLLFNIARIGYMVLWAPKMSPEWANNFLHDSLGLFLLGTIMLVQLEMGWWRSWSRRRRRDLAAIKSGEMEEPERASIIPGSIRLLFQWFVILGGIACVIGAIVFGIYRGRPAHRGQMLRGVVDGLMTTDPGSVEAAVSEALRFLPDDRELKTKLIQSYVIGGKYAEALQEIELIRESGLSIQEQALEAWSFMRMQQVGKARGVLGGMPVEANDLPGVAMLRAELAVVDNQPAVVALNAVRASRSHLMLPRVRTLFPYMAMHELWSSIVDADHDQPYHQPVYALISLQAHLRAGDLPGASRVLRHAQSAWPNDLQFLSSLYVLARHSTGENWRGDYINSVRTNLARMSAEQLAGTIEQTFSLDLPELAWLAYARLAVIDPQTPVLSYAAARFAPSWLQSRSHDIGVRAEDSESRTDLSPVLAMLEQVAPFKQMVARIPIYEELAAGGGRAVRRISLTRCLRELELRQKSERLPRRLQSMYASALAMDGKFARAHEELDTLAADYPAMAPSVLTRHASLYNSEGRWEECYEVLRQYHALDGPDNLTVELLLANCFANMQLGLAALDVLQKARLTFPNEARIQLGEAAVWDIFGHNEEALWLLHRAGTGLRHPILVDLYLRTGRLRKARTLASALSMELPPEVFERAQPLKLAPAEWELMPRWGSAYDAAERTSRIEALDAITAAAAEKGSQASPFMVGLRGMTRQWLVDESAGTTQASSEQWRAIGRDAREQAAALYRLAMLEARAKRPLVARAAALEGLKLLPGSPVLWRIYVSLAESPATATEDAFVGAPDDAGIWLGHLAARVKAKAWDEVEREVERALTGSTFSVGTRVRAGDLLLRAGRPQLAMRLAEQVVPEAEGLLPAYVLGIESGIAVTNRVFAMDAALRGAEEAIGPMPFFRAMVELKARGREVDADLFRALEYLHAHDGATSQWSEMLGSSYFAQGDIKRAFSVFSRVIQDRPEKVRVESLLMAAESARLQDNLKQSIQILEAAFAVHPDRVSILNNLVYFLSQDEATLPRARQLLPRLIDKAGNNAAILDTIATVYMRSGKLDKAQNYVDQALGLLKAGEYAAPEVKLNAARVSHLRGEKETAKRLLWQVREESADNQFIDLQARRLLREIDMAP